MGIWVEEEQAGYKKALRNSEHKAALIFNQGQQSNKRKRKSRNLIFFNPTFNREVKTDIGRQFLRLIDKNFPSNDPISEIINRKTVKHGQSDIIT